MERLVEFDVLNIKVNRILLDQFMSIRLYKFLQCIKNCFFFVFFSVIFNLQNTIITYFIAYDTSLWNCWHYNTLLTEPFLQYLPRLEIKKKFQVAFWQLSKTNWSPNANRNFEPCLQLIQVTCAENTKFTQVQYWLLTFSY